MKDEVLIFSTHLFILSIRLFAVALFTVSYKWWVTTVLILHLTVITISDIVWLCRGRGRNEWEQLWEVFKSFFYWFHRQGDDFSIQASYVQEENKKECLRRMPSLFSSVCDRKHHHDPVVLFQSFPSHLVLLTSHYLRLFVCCSRGNNETYSLQLLKEEIRFDQMVADPGVPNDHMHLVAF